MGKKWKKIWLDRKVNKDVHDAEQAAADEVAKVIEENLKRIKETEEANKKAKKKLWGRKKKKDN